MPKRSGNVRLGELVASATDAFIESGGYRRTHMSDVARRMAVSQGTLYNYVESKEALFDLAVRCLYKPELARSYTEFPIRTPDPHGLEQFLREGFAETIYSPTLHAALENGIEPSVEELGRIVRELHRYMYEHRWSVKLLDVCVHEFPELVALWYSEGRLRIFKDLVRYLLAGIEQGAFNPVTDVMLSARMIMQMIGTWAVRIHWDPAPMPFPPEDVEQMVVDFATGPFQAMQTVSGV